MYLDDVPINYWGVLIAAIVYFIIGLIWYAPFAFGGKKEKSTEHNTRQFIYNIGSYLGEFIISLVIAYVLALFIQISQSDEIVEGVAVAFWTWVGFIATTHFSAVLWARKTLEHFLIHVGFMLVGLTAMAIVIMYIGF